MEEAIDSCILGCPQKGSATSGERSREREKTSKDKGEEMKVVRVAKDKRRRKYVVSACLAALLCVAGPAWAEQSPEELDSDEGTEAGETEEVDEGVEAAEEDEGAEEESPEAVERPDVRFFVLPADGLEGELSELVLGRINESIRERIDSLGGVELLPTFEAMQGAATREGSQQAIADAERAYTSGIGLVRSGRHGEASSVLQRAVDVLEENVANLTNFGVLSDAMANLAVAHYEVGYDLDARDYIRRYAHLEPEQELDSDLFPQGLIELYEEEVRRVEEAGTGVVNIDADRPGAQIFINGEFVGTTPLQGQEVGFGEHYLVVRDGEWEYSGGIQVRGRDQEQDEFVEMRDTEDEDDMESGLPAFYVDLRETLRSGRFDQQMEPYFEELASQTGAEYIGWTIGHMERGSYAVIPFVYRAEDGAIAQGEEVLFDRDLTNVRSRSGQVSDIMATWVVHLPEDQLVEEVDLIEEEEVEEEVVPVAEVDEPAEEEEEVAVADDTQPAEELPVPGATPGQSGLSDAWHDEPFEDDSSNRMMYMGLGGAALGVVAGTMFLLLRGSEPPTGFSAEVEW